MSVSLITLPGIALMLALGLRHGLDPDHVATVDGLTYRALGHRPERARWIGTLFATGHGAIVTAIAVAVGLLGHHFEPPATLAGLIEWTPVALLLGVGTANLRALQRAEDYRPQGWKSGLLPKRLAQSDHPLAVVLIGILFGLVFDTATQAAAWGYAATASGGAVGALLVGVIFTVGMIATDTLDGRLMCHFLRLSGDDRAARGYRRGVGYFTVLIAYGVGSYAITSHFYPALEISDATFSLVGASLVALVAAACAVWHLGGLLGFHRVL
jgi:high-affinity nickel-transport protein